MPKPFVAYRHLSCGIVICLWAVVTVGCPGSKSPSPADYARQVSVFTIGTLALETGTSPTDRTYLTQSTQVAPEEPASWANLGLLELRANKYDTAAQYLKKAETEAPDNAAIQKLLGLLGERQGDLNASIAHYKKAVQALPDDLRARYGLAAQLERQGNPEGEKGFQEQIQEILKLQPYNLFAQIELARISARLNDAVTLRQALSLLQARAATFPAAALTQLKTLQAAALSNPRSATTQALFLQNYLKATPDYHASYLTLVGDPSVLGDPVERFLKLPVPVSSPTPPDTALTFAAQPLPGVSGKGVWAAATWLDGGRSTAGQPDQPIRLTTLMCDGHTLHLADGKTLPFPGGPKAFPPGPNGVLALDINYDFKSDFALAGQGGFKLYVQNARGGFDDATSKTKLPDSVLKTPYTAAWQADIEADGEIDIVLAPVSGPPLALRNNADGTFAVTRPFAGITKARDFAWADLDNGGNPAAIFVDANGALHVFANQRAGLFRARALPPLAGKAVAVTAAQMSAGGSLDLLVLMADGHIARLADKGRGSAWELDPSFAQWTTLPKDLTPGAARLFAADLDNNGGMDLIASTPTAAQIWLCDEKYHYAPLASPPPGAALTTVIDLNGDGRLDLVGLDPRGQPVQLLNSGKTNYGWEEMRLQPAQAEMDRTQFAAGDRRVNSFAIGGELEARAGMLYLKQMVAAPVVHFGLGIYKQMDAVRMLWPNGDIRGEFGDELKPNAVIIAYHRLKGSCPFLFAWNGHEMKFVTDCIWRSPLGLKINAQVTAYINQTEDWVKIAGDQLVPRDGLYDLRITAELWETHFFDHLSLLAVDHPVGTEIWVDERFSRTPPPHRVYLTGPLQPIARATDDLGSDVSELLRERDGRHLDTFGRGVFQGVTRDHYVEVELPANAPRTGPVYLICQGWIHPTDSSINVALGHSGYPPPKGIALETPDAQGRWSAARPDLGFPEGKVKTILIDLNGVFKPGAPRKLRLRTNLEVYWDAIRWAAGISHAEPKITHLQATTAELRYRGFSVVKAADASSPELPQSYDQLEGVVPKWRDLEGYYTRFGDVKPLLARVDDRYVIMNAGDEMRLTFAALPAPSAGMTRDFVLIGDGWVKDGDYNTTFSRTVLPAPTHASAAYSRPPTRLEDDPVYRQHRNDWQTYHTRYVMPDQFMRGLKPAVGPPSEHRP